MLLATRVAFVTCVKSLTSRFSRISASSDDSSPSSDAPPPVPWRNHSITPRDPPAPVIQPPPPPPPPPREESTLVTQLSELGDSSEFPPPPSPLPFVADDQEYVAAHDAVVSDNSDIYNTLPRRGRVAAPGTPGDECPVSSSSSSTESMPFANDNVATIKQVRHHNTHHNHNSLVSTPVREHAPPPPLSSVVSAPPSVATSPTHYPMWGRHRVPYLSNNHDSHATQQPHNHVNKSDNGDVIEDIETMLANLSNQLDAMLEKKD